MPVISAITAAAASIGAWFGTLSVGAATLVQLGAGIVLNAIGAAVLAPDIEKPGISGQVGAGEDVPRSVIFGNYATRGSIVYAATWGKAGDTPNAYFTRVTALSDLPVRGLNQVWIDGRLCRLDWRREVTDPNEKYYGQGVPIVEFTKTEPAATYDDESGRWIRDDNGQWLDPDLNGTGKIKPYAWVKFYDGTQTAADEFLINSVSNDQYQWGADAVGYGVAYAITTFRVEPKFFSGFPDIVFDVAGVRLVNPITGQIGADDENPIVQACAIVAGLRYGDQWLYGPQGPAAGLILPDGLDWQIAACNLPVPGAAGMTSEERIAAFGSDQIPARYRSGYEVKFDQEAPDVLKEILKACNGRFVDLGDCVRFQVGDPTDAGAAITDDDILISRPRSKTPFASVVEAVNGVRGLYPEPSAGWEVQDAPPLYFEALEALDDNRRLVAEVTLNAVPFAEQVQRLMKITVLEARREIRHEIELPSPFAGIEAGDFIDWTSAEFGYQAKRFRVVRAVPAAGVALAVSLVEADPVDYVFLSAATDFVNRDRRLVPLDPPPFQLADDQWSVTGGGVENDGRRAVAPALVINWPEVSGLVGIEYRVTVFGTDEPAAAGSIYAVDEGSHKIANGILPGVPYWVEIRPRVSGGGDVLWSDRKAVQAPNYKQALADLAADVSGAIDDAAQSAEADKLAAEGARDLALVYRDGSQAAQGAAEGARDLALVYRDGSQAAQGAAEGARDIVLRDRRDVAALASGNIVGKSIFEDGDATGWDAPAVAAPAGHPLGRTMAMHQTARDNYFKPAASSFFQGSVHGRRFRVRGYVYCDGAYSARVGMHSRGPDGAVWPTGLGSDPGGGWVYFDHVLTVTDPDGDEYRPFLQVAGPSGGEGKSAYWTDLIWQDVTEITTVEDARDLALAYRDGAQAARDQTLGRLDAAIVFREGANGLELAPGTDVAGGVSPLVRASAGAVLSSQSIGRDLLQAYITGARVFAQTPGGQSIGAGAMNWTEVQRVVVDPEGMPVQFQISALLRKVDGDADKFAHVRFRRGLSVLFTTSGLNASRGFKLPAETFVTVAMTVTDVALAVGAQTYVLEVARENNWTATFEVNSATISAKVEAV